MNVSTPHYMLLLEANLGRESGRWRFSLRGPDGSEQLEVADVEPKIRGERLDLLTVVRALEALDQPSHVTLVGCSPYVRHGMQYGLPEWRSNGWRWEFFGQMVPVKNGDLWQRLDRTLRFHRVECRQCRFDLSHGGPACPHSGGGQETDMGVRFAARNWIKYAKRFVPRSWQRGAGWLIQHTLDLRARRWVCGLRWHWTRSVNSLKADTKTRLKCSAPTR